MDKSILTKWLAAGYMEEGILYSTEAGTPQGGIASPTLANMALDGLEQAARTAASPDQKVHVIRYADDFIINRRRGPFAESRDEDADHRG